ncbi:DNA methylase [Acetobacter estunensis NRIC 0472]|uniref:Lactate dehydrogenase n=1 Tax=Acetobacter estunensis TaxID=104097 RepID=A0A967BDM5_9PROT|nr:DEAD/DEAH box helicase family protein [Acetobacter estunensis]NHO55128.1 lactate dehydrogenase [Acetobacter estunensis]GBQ21546.1 DNA methylase [Acetobacter estunensis NRIC 0472]
MSASSQQFSLFDTTALSGDLAALWSLDDDQPIPEVAPAPAEPLRIPARDFRLDGVRGLAHGWKARAEANVAAIALVAALEREDRNATPAEQDVLARFTGFGAGELANGLFPAPGKQVRKGWEDVASELTRLTSESERAGLQRATQYAHYTPELIVHSLWDMAQRMGFRGGSVLEPGCGTGLFIAARPAKLEGKIAFTGIENDPISARIARKLYPNQWIRSEDFTRAQLIQGYDLAIGNPPFSNRSVHGREGLEKLGLSLHDFFIARSIEALRPGGIALFVTSRYTLDKTDPTARRTIAESADLLGAVRLPEGAMRDDAGTDVVVDVLAFRKREIGEAPGDETWLETGEIADSDEGTGPLIVNRYLLANPVQALGTHAWTTTQFGPGYTCAPRKDTGLDVLLPEALSRIAPNVHFLPPRESRIVRPAGDGVRIGTAATGADLKEGSYFVEKGMLHQIIDGQAQLVAIRKAGSNEGIFAKHGRIISALVPVRDSARAVLRAQMANQPYGELQRRLKTAYLSFVREFGPINHTRTTVRVDEESGAKRETQRRPNIQPFVDDPDVWLVASIEDYDEATDTGRMGPIFSERVIHAPSEPEIHGAHDALAVSLHETGRVDLALIAELLGRSEADALTELGESVYLDAEKSGQGRDVWVTADEMLSGAVRTKLARAREAAQGDPRFARTVAALEGVQPSDLRPSEITARLGAPWLPVADIEAFVSEVMGVQTTIHHTPSVACWSIDRAPFVGKVEATSVWGTERRNAAELLDDALTQSIPKIWDHWKDENGNDRRTLNTQQTEAAKEKLGAIRRAFETWVWQDADRSDRLVKLYNETYNNLVPRAFDGSHLRLPGASSAITLRPHQKRVIWRIVASGNTYMAHAVGAGKTFSMAAAVMEQKRLGLISKACIVVPGHCLAQMAKEFLMLYPTARILVADETNFVKAKRQRFIARAATENWDAIIITHDAFKFIPVEGDFERGMIESQIASYETLLTDIDKDDRISRKRIERMREGMEAKLEGLAARKDDLLHMGEIGIDQILVDEAQLFRKLSYATNQSDLRGVDPNGSQRAWDLFVKTRYLSANDPTRPLIMASGSPITNTIAELWNVGRYMNLAALEARDLHEFDAWSASFGETRTELELQPNGQYKPVTRFTEFVNVADLIAMYRDFADVVQSDELRKYVKLPDVRGGKRQIVVADNHAEFKAFQKTLAWRMQAIEERTRRPQKGDDIILSVMNDARFGAIDLRFVDPFAANDNRSKLNAMIRKVFAIWQETSANRYTNPDTGRPYDLPGAVQMIFSDLGTEAAQGKRGFSAYVWIRSELIRMGVPAEQIAFMQDYDKAAAKLRLFGDLNAGRKRILIGSTATMGTGVNAQQRLIALHHLDVPWLVADIMQREGRIERQGNQNAEIQIYAYAQQGSVDATNWQLLERKMRFIGLAMSGDRSIRRIEDVGGEGNDFAMAKALASGDMRLIQKAGLEADIARLERLQAAHYDDQFNVRRQIQHAERDIATGASIIPKLEAAIARRVSTKGEAFALHRDRGVVESREKAGAWILSQARLAEREKQEGRWAMGRIAGFEVVCEARESQFYTTKKEKPDVESCVFLDTPAGDVDIEIDRETKPLGLISRIEHAALRFDGDLANARRSLEEAERRLPGYRARQGLPFTEAGDLEAKLAELAALDADLEASGKEEEAALKEATANDDSAAETTEPVEEVA